MKTRNVVTPPERIRRRHPAPAAAFWCAALLLGCSGPAGGPERPLDAAMEPAAFAAEPAVSASAAPDTVSVTDVTALYWRDPFDVQGANFDTTAYRTSAVAPDYAEDQTAGEWMLYGIAARASASGTLKCLRTDWRNVNSGETTTRVEGDCSDPELAVALEAPYVAAGVSIKIRNNDVVGLGLAYGELQYSPDPLFPMFLKADGRWKVSGETGGNYAPLDFDDDWEYGVVGVAINKNYNPDNVVKKSYDGIVVTFAELAPPPPAGSALFAGHTVDEIEAATKKGLNTVYDTVAETLTFEIYDGCTSTIPTIDFCNELQVKVDYSSALALDDACVYTCKYVVVPGCEAEIEACKATCSLFGCSCPKSCDDEEEDCIKGCQYAVSGSVTMLVDKVRGLDDLNVKSASVPYLLPSAPALAVDVVARVGTLKSIVTLKFCQSGSCSSTKDFTITSDPMDVTATGSLVARDCAAGSPALYLSLTEIDATATIPWNTDDFVDDVESFVEDEFDFTTVDDWVDDVMEDAFDLIDDLYGETYDVLAMDAIEKALNAELEEIPMIGCSTASASAH